MTPREGTGEERPSACLSESEVRIEEVTAQGHDRNRLVSRQNLYREAVNPGDCAFGDFRKTQKVSLPSLHTSDSHIHHLTAPACLALFNPVFGKLQAIPQLIRG